MARLAKESVCLKQRLGCISKLDRMRREENLTDAVLVCGDRRYPVHRTVLIPASAYFEAMFRSSMKESLTGEVDLSAYSADAVATVIDFIYKDTLADIWCLKELKEVIRVSHVMQIEPLYEYYVQQMGEVLNAKTCIQVWEILQLYDNAALRKRVRKMIAANFGKIVLQTDYLNLSLANMKTLLRGVPLTADRVVRGIAEWVRFSRQARRDKLVELLDELVNLDDVSSAQLNALLNDESLVGTNQALFSKLVLKAFSRLPQNKRVLNADEDQNIHLFTNENGKGVMKTFNVRERSWSPSARLLLFDLVEGMAVAEHEGHVYFFGGKRQENMIYRHSPFANTSSHVGELRTGVHFAGAGVHNGLIYVVGAADGTKAVQRFNPETAECVEVAPTNEFHQWPFVFEAGDRLHVVGSVQDSRSLERYDDDTGQWTIVTHVPHPMSWARCALYRDDLVVNCNDDAPNFCRYDFDKKAWSDVNCDNQPDRVYGLLTVQTSSGEDLLISKNKKGQLAGFNSDVKTWECVCLQSSDVDYKVEHAVVMNTFHA